MRQDMARETKMNILLTDDDNLILQEVKSILGRMVPEKIGRAHV